MTRPVLCLICNTPLHHELTWSQLFSFKRLEFDCVCVKCRGQFIPFTRQSESCSACGKELAAPLVDEELLQKQPSHVCFDCQRWLKLYPANYLKHEAIFEYNDMLREWLYRYKYQADRRQSEVVATFLSAFYNQRATYKWLVLPSSPVSLRERGFHATGNLLDEAGIPYTMPLVYKGDGRKQAKKDRYQRISMQQPFALMDQDIFLNGPQCWLIFDDVYTTGATILKAKEVLFQSWKASGHSIHDLQIVSASLTRESLKEKESLIIKNSLNENE